MQSVLVLSTLFLPLVLLHGKHSSSFTCGHLASPPQEAVLHECFLFHESSHEGLPPVLVLQAPNQPGFDPPRDPQDLQLSALWDSLHLSAAPASAL